MVQPAVQPPLDGRQLTRRARPILLAPLLAVLLLAEAAAQQRVPGADWQHLEPATSGWSETGLAEARERSKLMHATGVMIVHRGAVVGEWGDTAKRTELASVRKSLLSALIGIAVAERKIALDSTLAALGIDDNPPPLTEVEKTATVRMLLQARSGVYHPALYETAAMARARPARGSHAPGTFFYYNNWDFNALGTIYERATGSGIYDALDRLIAKSTGMQDYRPSDGTYFTGADSDHRAYPIRMSARDLARFALLYLNKGAWGGRQIVPAAWVAESTQPYSAGKAGGVPVGYGYLWWTAPPEPGPGLLGEGWFSALGAGGQYGFVKPALDLVVVLRVDRDQRLPEPRFADFAEFLALAVKAGGLDKAR
jgi:CubicO group peptidase (beta-lactamase class C family)